MYRPCNHATIKMKKISINPKSFLMPFGKIFISLFHQGNIELLSVIVD